MAKSLSGLKFWRHHPQQHHHYLKPSSIHHQNNISAHQTRSHCFLLPIKQGAIVPLPILSNKEPLFPHHILKASCIILPDHHFTRSSSYLIDELGVTGNFVSGFHSLIKKSFWRTDFRDQTKIQSLAKEKGTNDDNHNNNNRRNTNIGSTTAADIIRSQVTCCAEIRSPVRTISMARDFPTARGSRWVPPKKGKEFAWPFL